MTTPRTPSNRFAPAFEACEDRALMTVVFVFNGNSFNAAKPDSLTANAAAVLRNAGEQVVQLSNPRINTPAAYHALAEEVVKLARGRPVGLVGFSAGGALALHIAQTPGLNVESVLAYYSVPDVADFLSQNAASGFVRPIAGLAPFRPAMVSLLSGPIATDAHVVAAYGQLDPNVTAEASTADLLADDPTADVFTYPGGHGVPITASPSALDDFLAHLS